MNNATPRGRSFLRPTVGFFLNGCIVVVGIAIGLSIVYAIFSVPEATEFSPFSFNLRKFQTNRLFRRTVVQPPSLACSANITKHLTRSTKQLGSDRWDLAWFQDGFQGKVKWEAALLVEPLAFTDEGGKIVWEEWSTDHPALAKILWPAIQDLAIHRCYFAIPQLLRFAKAIPTTESLRDEIARVSLTAGTEQAARQVAKSQFLEARQTIGWAKAFGSSDEMEAIESKIRDGLPSLDEPPR